MSDIVERLRGTADAFELAQAPHHLALYMRVAADEIERLRAGGCARDQTTTQYCAEAAQMAAEVERLRAALQNIVDGDVPRPVGKRYRADGQESKNDQCIHGEWMYDECWGCTSDLARAALHPAPIQGEKGVLDAHQG